MATLWIGGKIFDYVMWSIQSIFIFFTLISIMNSWGSFDALDDHTLPSTSTTVITGLCLSLVLLLTVGISFLMLAASAKSTFGIAIGYIVVYNIYMLLFGWWVDNYTWFLWLCLIAGMLVFALFFRSLSNYSDENLFLFFSSVFAMYTLLRTFHLFFGWNFPGEFEILNMMHSGNHSLPGMFIVYFLLIFLGAFFSFVKQKDDMDVSSALRKFDS
jgi:hypothetical protein